MGLTGFHLQVAKILGRTAGDQGFALGGGYGLQMHQITDRPSKDLDTYVDQFDTGPFDAAERDLVRGLRDNGLEANVRQTNDVLRVIEVRNPENGEEVVVDLAYDYRQNPPVQMGEIGPVLDIEDLATGKLRAFVDRQAERDYTDLDRLWQTGRWSGAQLYGKVASVRPEISRGEFAQMIQEAGEGDPAIYRALGLSSPETQSMAARLEDLAKELRTGLTKTERQSLEAQRQHPTINPPEPGGPALS